MPTSSSLAATHSAASRSPALVAVSPVFVVSIRMRSESSSATSAWAPASGVGFVSDMSSILPPGALPGRREPRLCSSEALRESAHLVRVAEWQTR